MGDLAGEREAYLSSLVRERGKEDRLARSEAWLRSENATGRLEIKIKNETKFGSQIHPFLASDQTPDAEPGAPAFPSEIPRCLLTEVRELLPYPAHLLGPVLTALVTSRL